MQVEQYEILFQMQGKFQKLGIDNFKCFEVFCGIVMALAVFFVEF